MGRPVITTPCPCGLANDYDHCCGQYITGQMAAPNAETLMRSRYTAYTLAYENYLLASWHPTTRPATLDLHSEPSCKWLGLQVKQSAQQDETHATVAFIARYKINGRAFRLHENSRFIRENEHWYYVDGDIS